MTEVAAVDNRGFWILGALAATVIAIFPVSLLVIRG